MGVRPAKTIAGAAMETLSFLEASNQTFLEGAPVEYSGGYVRVAPAGTAASVDTDHPILGFAAEDAHNVTQGTQLIRVYPALPNYVFEAYWASDAATAPVIADVGNPTLYTLGYDSTNKRWFLDKQWTTKGMCIILGPGLGCDTFVANTVVQVRAQFVVTAAGRVSMLS